jgi:hypothetical protein
MPEAQRLIGDVVAEPQHVAAMRAALNAARERVSPRFIGASPEVIALARTDLANAIIDAFRIGATDAIVLKHSGMSALKRLHPERFEQDAAE